MPNGSDALKTAIIVGLIVGLAQFVIVYPRTITKKQKIAAVNVGEITCDAISPACGDCGYKVVDGYCVHSYTQKFRGFPLSNASYGAYHKTNVDWKNFVNLICWLVVIALPVYLAQLIAKPKKK